MSGNPHPDRPIAVPKRRLNRTTSTNSVGSTGSQGSTSPLTGFSFGNATAPLTAAKPPVQLSSPFSNTGFGSPSIPGLSSSNNNNPINSPLSGFQTGFGNTINTPPTSSSAAPSVPNTGFGGFGNTSNATSFSGFGNPSSNLSPNPPSSLGAFGTANVPTSTAASASPIFSPNFGSSNNSVTNSPFSGFQMTAQPHAQPVQQLQPARITEITDDSDMDSEPQGVSSAATKPSLFTSGFASSQQASEDKSKSTPAFTFGSSQTSVASSSTDTSKGSPFAGFSFTKLSEVQSTTDKPATTSPFGTFGTASANKSITSDKKDEALPISSAASNVKPAAAFTFGTSAPVTSSAPTSSASPFGGIPAKSSESNQPTNTPAKTTDAPPPFGSFGKPVTTAAPTSSAGSTAPAFAGFGAKPSTDKEAEPKKTSETPSLFGPFGGPAKITAAPASSTAFSFGAPKSTTTADEKKTDETVKSAERPSMFGSISTTTKPSEDKSSEESSKKSITDTPSPFAAFSAFKPTTSTTEKSNLSASVTPFKPLTSLTDNNSSATTPSFFGSFGEPDNASDKDAKEKDDESTAADGKRSSISSVGSNKSSTSTTSPSAAAKPSPFTFTKPTQSTSESDKQTTPSSGLFGKSPAPSTTGSAFSFSKPSTTAGETDTTTPAKTTTTSTSSFTFNKPSESSSKSFTFGTPATSSTDKPDATATSLPFTFGKPADKASSFSMPKASGDSSSATPAKPAASFSFGASSSSDTPPSNKKRQLDRDDDEDGPSASKKSFSIPTSASKAASSNKAREVFKFTGTPDTGTSSGAPASNAPFTFNFNSSTAPTAATTGDSSTKPPIFTFGSPANATSSEENTSADKVPVYTFGTQASKEKKLTSAPFTFGVPSTTKSADKSAASEKKNFNFGPPPPLGKVTEKSFSETSQAATTTTKPVVSLGSPSTAKSKSITELEEGEIDSSSTGEKIGTSGLSFGGKSTTAPLHKSPLSKSTTSGSSDSLLTSPVATGATKDSGSKDKETGSKKVTFNLAKSTPVVAAPSVSLAFSKVGSSDSDTSSATLNLSAPKKNIISSEKSSVPTTLQSNVTEPSQITYKTRFWELPDEARNELAQLAHFISEQTDKHDKIAQEIESSFGPTLNDIHLRSLALDTDATILRKQLEVQSESLNGLIEKNKVQRLNAHSAGYVRNQDTKNWRVRGAAENWDFLINTIESMEHRLRQFTLATESIEEAIVGFQRRVAHTPESIGSVMDHHRRLYLNLAGRVAELHQEVDRVAKRRKLN